MMHPAEPDVLPQGTLWMMDLGQPLPTGPVLQVPVVFMRAGPEVAQDQETEAQVGGDRQRQEDGIEDTARGPPVCCPGRKCLVSQVHPRLRVARRVHQTNGSNVPGSGSRMGCEGMKSNSEIDRYVSNPSPTCGQLARPRATAVKKMGTNAQAEVFEPSRSLLPEVFSGWEGALQHSEVSGVAVGCAGAG